MKKSNLSNSILQMNFMKKATENALKLEEISSNQKWSLEIEEGIYDLMGKSPFSRPSKLSKYIIANSRIKSKRSKQYSKCKKDSSNIQSNT